MAWSIIITCLAVAVMLMPEIGSVTRFIFGFICGTTFFLAMYFEDKQKDKINELERRVRELEQTK